jgi:hypothetical protein
MKTLAYWKQSIGVALLVMVTGYWLMSAFTFVIPVWIVVLASTLAVLLFVDWLSGRFPAEELTDWLPRPISLAVLALIAYGVLSLLGFLPSSALLLAVLVSTVVVDLVLGRVFGSTQELRSPVRAEAPSA